jgi:protein-tyrosine-phosphatase
MVCLGNICRSPLAEGILRNLAAERGIADRIFVDSAGTTSHTLGADPDHRSRAVAEAHGITLAHKARPIERADFSKFDVILVMDEANLADVRSLAATEWERSKVSLVTAFDPRPCAPVVVPDPYWGELADFTAAYAQLRHCLEGWLATVTAASASGR